MTTRTYCLPINPEPWAMGNAFVRRSGGKAFAAVAPNKTLTAYKEAVAAELAARGAKPISGPYILEFWFWRENVTYTDAGGRKRTRNSPDTTNMQKATEDALQGVLIENDRDVLSVRSHTVARGQGVDPMVVIQVTQVDEFDASTIPESVTLEIERERAAADEAHRKSLDDNTWIPGK